MEDNKNNISNSNILDDKMLLTNSEEFLKTLNKLVPKSDFVKSEVNNSDRFFQLKSNRSTDLQKEMKKESNNSNIISNINNLKLSIKEEIHNTNEYNSLNSGNSNFQNLNKIKSKSSNKLPQSSQIYPRQNRIQKIMKELDNEYMNQIKETDKNLNNKEDLHKEIAKYSKILNNVKRVNRDEDLLKMQKENQEVELQLKSLKNQDKTELRLKEEESRKLIEDLNNLFNEKKKEALEKDEERKKIVEEIKQIKKDQEDHKNTIKKYTDEKENLINTLAKLDKDILKLKCYQDFIDKVFESSNQTQNDGFSKLSNKFKELIESMETIQKDISDQENQIKLIKKQQQEILKKNDKQAQNKRLIELENEIKEYNEKNKKLEKEIEEIQSKNQKKDSDTHQIKLSINNLYLKCKYKENEDLKRKKENEHQNYNKKKNKEKKDLDLDVDDSVLCLKLTEINEKILDLVKIYKELEP